MPGKSFDNRTKIIYNRSIIERFLNIIEKTVFADIPFLVPAIHENHLRLLNALIGYLAVSPIPTLNIDTMARNFSVGKEKLYQLLNVLEEIGLILIVRYSKDYKVSGKGAKIFLADPSMYSALGGNVSNVREAFTASMFRQIQKKIFACKDETKGDFIVDKLTLEVGGISKKHKMADFVIADDIERPVKNAIPLWSLGMMY